MRRKLTNTKLRVAVWASLGAIITWHVMAFVYLGLHVTEPWQAYLWTSSGFHFLIGIMGVVLASLYGVRWKRRFVPAILVGSIIGGIFGCSLIPLQTMSQQRRLALLFDDPLYAFGNLATVLVCTAVGVSLASLFTSSNVSD